MTWQYAIALFSALAFLIPVILIVTNRLYRYNHYFALLIYCLITLGYNIMILSRAYIEISLEFVRGWGLINNLLDMPVMLMFLMLFATSQAQKFRMKIYLAVFVLFEIVVLFTYGFNKKAVTITMAPGLLLIFSIAFYFFIRKMKQSLLQNKALGKAFITGSITFAYGCFGFLYLMHYVLAVDDLKNIMMIYYIVVTIFSGLLTTGLILENKRLRKMEELMQTRKELIQFFSDERKPLRNNGHNLAPH